jgi:hypothetical protein
MSKKPKCLYIFPSNLEHEGINVKLNGQVDALKSVYNTRLVTLQYKRHESAFSILLALLSFELKAAFWSLLTPTIYMRYNPKTPYIMIFLSILSWFGKRIYIEHNTLLEQELKFLERKSEIVLHHIIMRFLRFSRVTHLCVNDELKEHLIHDFKTSPKRTVYIQNGFAMPRLNPDTVDLNVVKQVTALREKGKRIAIFTGNGYPWHGLNEIVSILKDRTDVELVVAGPYKSDNMPDNIHLLGKMNTSTLYTLYELSDIAISTFRWDMLNITQGSPLKTREYLCSGLPILVHYYDCAMDFDSLRPYIFNYADSPSALDDILSVNIDKKGLGKEAQRVLSWKSLWKDSVLKNV